MRAVAVLFGGALRDEAFSPLTAAPGLAKNSFELALERAGEFPGVEKVVLLGVEEKEYPDLPDSARFSVVRQAGWTRKALLEALSRAGEGFDLVYFAWADCPFLDPCLAAALAARHTRYAAEYSYADGYPYGFAPELLAPGTAGILFTIDKDEAPVERSALFDVIQKDINAFDIETEISPADLRLYRLSLAADSRRNALLIARWVQVSDGFPAAASAASVIEQHPEILRTLPSFYNIQVAACCPQSCSFCPWPASSGFVSAADGAPPARRDAVEARGGLFMSPEQFAALLDRVLEFSGDAVISLSLWGECALHPQLVELAAAVFARPSLSLVLETSGIGWKAGLLDSLADAARAAPRRTGPLLSEPLSIIVSLDAFDPNRYRELRGAGFAEATAFARQALGLLPASVYVQAVRFTGAEDDIEAFYRYWKDKGPEFMGEGAKNAAGGRHVIIQKYNDFCGRLPRLQASDLSPVRRRPCWHLMRDVNITLDGGVLRCQQDVDRREGENLPNVFTQSLKDIWEARGAEPSGLNESPSGLNGYLAHARGIYNGPCAVCDEYYTYNF